MTEEIIKEVVDWEITKGNDYVNNKTGELIRHDNFTPEQNERIKIYLKAKMGLNDFYLNQFKKLSKDDNITDIQARGRAWRIRRVTIIDIEKN